MATVYDVITASLKDLGVLAANEVPTAQDAQDCLDGLNRLVDQWAAERLQIYTITRSTWTIVSGTQTYLVGLGNPVNIAWPVFIDHVNFQDTSVSPVLEYQLQPLTDDAWSKIPQRTLTSPYPTCWYFDHAFADGTLSLWPVPTSSTLQGVIYAPTAVTEFQTTASLVVLPPGYRRMIVKNLAAEMAPAFERAGTPSGQMLMKQAADSMAAVKRSNKRLSDLSIDAGALVQGRNRKWGWNIWTGP